MLGQLGGTSSEINYYLEEAGPTEFGGAKTRTQSQYHALTRSEYRIESEEAKTAGREVIISVETLGLIRSSDPVLLPFWEVHRHSPATR